MRNKIQNHITFYVLFMLWMGISIKQSSGAQIKAVPNYGDSVVYYDITAQGELLEIDYGKQQGRILGKIEWNSNEPLLLVAGWVLPGQYVYLLNTEYGFWGRLYLYSIEHGTLQKTSVLMELAGDSAFLPISATTSYLQYGDPETRKPQRFVFDASRNALNDTFTFALRMDSIYKVSDDHTRMFLAHPWESRLFEIDLTNNEILSERDVAQIVSSDNKNERVFVTAFYNNQTFVMKKFLKEKTIKWYIINLPDMRVLAESQPFPLFFGKYHLTKNDNDLLQISCIVEIVDAEGYKPTGVIQRFIVQDDDILPIESIEFEPATEVPLRENNGEFKIFPKYSFDYLSLLTIREKVFSQMPGRFTPDAIPFVKQLIRQIQEEFYTNPNREQRKVLELVE